VGGLGSGPPVPPLNPALRTVVLGVNHCGVPNAGEVGQNRRLSTINNRLYLENNTK